MFNARAANGIKSPSGGVVGERSLAAVLNLARRGLWEDGNTSLK